VQKTVKLGLNLPGLDDIYNIEDFNENTRKLDEVAGGVVIIHAGQNIPLEQRLEGTLYLLVSDAYPSAGGSVLFASPKMTGRIVG